MSFESSFTAGKLLGLGMTRNCWFTVKFLMNRYFDMFIHLFILDCTFRIYCWFALKGTCALFCRLQVEISCSFLPLCSLLQLISAPMCLEQSGSLELSTTNLCCSETVFVERVKAGLLLHARNCFPLLQHSSLSTAVGGRMILSRFFPGRLTPLSGSFYPEARSSNSGVSM